MCLCDCVLPSIIRLKFGCHENKQYVTPDILTPTISCIIFIIPAK